MFGGQANAQGMPPPGANPAAAGYGPPADQEMGYGQNPNQQQNPNYQQQPGGAYGAPGGQPNFGAPPAGAGGYNNQGPPGNYGGGAPTSGMAAKMPNATNPMNLIWFAAACSVMIGSIISCVTLLLSLEWVDALEMAYLFLFGMLLAVLDTPLFHQVAIVAEMRQ